MKRKIIVIGAIVLVFLLPASLTYVYFTSSFLEDNTAKIFAYFGQPSWTKADKAKVKDMAKQACELRKKANKEKPEVKDLLLRNWAEKNGKIQTLNYVERRFRGRIKKAAIKYGVKEELIKAVIVVEWHPKKNKSKKGAIGPMGLMPATAKALKIDPFHEYENILGGTKYLAKLIKHYKGNLKLALAAYNAGLGNVAKYKGVPPFRETKNYIGRVNYLYNYQL